MMIISKYEMKISHVNILSTFHYEIVIIWRLLGCFLLTISAPPRTTQFHLLGQNFRFVE